MRHWNFAASCLSVYATLSACNSAKDVLEPSAITPTEQSTTLAMTKGTDAATPAISGTESVAATAVPTQTVAVMTKARVQFVPVVGAKVEAATPLTLQIGARTHERGINLAGRTDTTLPGIILRDYFSATT